MGHSVVFTFSRMVVEDEIALFENEETLEFSEIIIEDKSFSAFELIYSQEEDESEENGQTEKSTSAHCSGFHYGSGRRIPRSPSRPNWFFIVGYFLIAALCTFFANILNHDITGR